MDCATNGAMVDPSPILVQQLWLAEQMVRLSQAPDHSSNPIVVQQLWLAKLLADDALVGPESPHGRLQPSQHEVRALSEYVRRLFSGEHNSPAADSRDTGSSQQMANLINERTRGADVTDNSAWARSLLQNVVSTSVCSVAITESMTAPEAFREDEMPPTPVQVQQVWLASQLRDDAMSVTDDASDGSQEPGESSLGQHGGHIICLLYTSPSPRDATLSRMPSSA